MSTRANLIECKGLVTSENELSVTPGSLRKATNVNVDEEGVITPRRGFNDYGGPTTGSETINVEVKQIMEYKDRIFRHYSNKLEFEDNTGAFNAISGTYNELLTGYRIKWQEANGNLYFTTDDGIKRISLKNNSSLTSGASVLVENAGVPKAAYIEGTATDTTGGFLPANSKVGYKFIFGKKDENGNLLLGSPSARYVVSNTNTESVTYENFIIEFTAYASLVNQDYVVIPTLNEKTTYYFNVSGGTVTEPYNTNTFGTNFVEVNISGASSNSEAAAILANYISINSPEYDVSLSSGEITLTSTERGNIDNAVYSGTGFGEKAASRTDGLVQAGNEAVVDITVVIPDTVTTDYFIQVYRTAYITATTGLTLADLDPGDEHYLIYEYGLETADITAGEYTFTDNTPDSFRAAAAPLYSNEITGEGILQSNDQPPIAMDIELFKSSMFYANTKSTHRLEITVISVDDFVSGATRIVIGNSTKSRYYLANFDTDRLTSEVSTTEGGKFYLSNSGSVGQAIDETVRSLVKMINKDNDSIVNAFYLSGSDDLPGKFLLESRSLTDSAFYVGLEDGAAAYDGGTAYVVGNQVKYSGYLYTCIQNTTGNAPTGAKTDNAYWSYLNLGAEFSPVIPESRQIEQIDGNTSDMTITLTSHGYSNGDSVYVSILETEYDDTVSYLSATPDIVSYQGRVYKCILDTTGGSGHYPSGTTSDNTYWQYLCPEFSGVYTVSSVAANTFDIQVIAPTSTVAYIPTNSAVYLPELESDNLEAANRLYYSKDNEPEAVPAANYINVGAKDEPIRRILALRDNLFVFKDDGVFLVSGTSAPNFSVRQTDNTRILAADSAVVLNNQIYCLTEQGVARVNGSGQVGIISSGIENLIDAVANASFDYVPNTFGISYENDRAYIIFMPQVSTDTSATQAYRYNIFERTWTRWEYNATCGHVLTRDNKLYLGNGDRNYISQERKNFEREDHADRDFAASITVGGVNDTIIELGNITNVQVTDVITQTQAVTIDYLNNRILRRMDEFDTGITPPVSSTMLLSFGASAGDDMVSKMQALNDYLNTLDAANITSKSFTTVNIKTNTDLLVDELNTAATITFLKSYKKPESTEFEAYIKAVDVNNNKITIHSARPFLSGAVSIFKHIEKEVEWNPQHFGDPSALKQVSEVTIMFDQNNFYDATAKFGSDVSQNLTSVPFQGKGIGYFGDNTFSGKNDYFGGNGNDIPYRTVVPRGKQRCRYLTIAFEHYNARESFRILGISGVVRSVSSRAYR